MLRVTYCAEWIYYGFWYLLASLVLNLPRAVAWNKAPWGWKLRQPWHWIVQQGWVLPYLHTMAERKAMYSNAEVWGRRSAASSGPTRPTCPTAGESDGN